MTTTAHPMIGYLDCFAGISGDMLLGALLDAGLPEPVLRSELRKLPVAGYTISCRQIASPLRATRVEIACTEVQPCRTWREIKLLLEESGLAPAVRDRALRVFEILARAEARVHGCPPEEVHFHEVGGVDAIVDIVGAAIGLVHLGVEHLTGSPLPMPRGWVDCAHGRLPVPAPAVCEILREVPVYGTELEAELVTPTGAALLKGLAREFGPFPTMTISSVGYGAGSRELPDRRPNLLRLVLGAADLVREAQEVEIIETHLDDWSPEGYPFLCEQLLTRGALDVGLLPMQMKKGRPGFLLRVMAEPATAWELKRLILSETTALGLHYRSSRRWTLSRVLGTVATPWGRIAAKQAETPTGTVITPEYEACREVALRHAVPLREVYDQVRRSDPASFRGS